MLDGATADRYFRNRATTIAGRTAHINPNIRGCGWRVIKRHVGFDITARHLEVSYVSIPNNHATALVVGDVRADDVDLMQIHVIQKNSDTFIFIEMAGRNDRITIPIHQMHAVATPTHRYTLQNRPHASFEQHPIGQLRSPQDLKPLKNRHALIPSRWLKRLR